MSMHSIIDSIAAFDKTAIGIIFGIGYLGAIWGLIDLWKRVPVPKRGTRVRRPARLRVHRRV